MDTTGLMCRSCQWFGVYRSDVTERMVACPVCGRSVLSAREIDQDEWHEVGRQLLDADEAPPAAGLNTFAPGLGQVRRDV